MYNDHISEIILANQVNVLTGYFVSMFSLVCCYLLFLLEDCFLMAHVKLCASELA